MKLSLQKWWCDMNRDMPVSGRILELFTSKRPELTITQICHLLPDDEVGSLKSAVRRLRGEGGKERCIRAKRYIHQAGHGGLPLPVFVLGTEPDAPKEQEFVTLNDEVVKRACEVRRKREALSLKRELESLDSYS